MRPRLIEQAGLVRRGRRKRPGAELQGQGSIEVKIDEVNGFHVYRVSNRVEDLAASRGARPVPPVGMQALDLSNGLLPLCVGDRNHGE